MPSSDARLTVLLADSANVLPGLADESIDLVYIDPLFNTGRSQVMRRIKVQQDDSGDRIGFQGRRYRTMAAGSMEYSDKHDNYLAFLEPILEQIRRTLKPTGSLYFHSDYREVHYCKVLLDRLFGRECFLNEIVWAYDYGARSRTRWPAKHDNILLYVKHPRRYYFNIDVVDRIPYMAPGLVGPEKVARGKTPTDTWWHTIVPPGGKERTGYPNQKPLGILRRIVAASSLPDGLVADFFAGSGTTGAAALELGRRGLLVDKNPDAYAVMQKRLAEYGVPIAGGIRA